MYNKMKKVNCTVIGDAMVDIVLPLSNAKNLEKLALGNVFNTSSKITPGGVANVAVALSKLGCSSGFIGKVGNDCFGKLFRDDLEKHNVISNVTVSRTKGTGMVFDLVFPDGERGFFVDRGANAELVFEDVDLDLIQSSSFLYTSGFFFQDERTCETIKKVIEEAIDYGTTIVFNPRAPNIAEKFRDTFLDIIRRYVDILILNEEEGRCLVGNEREDDVISSLLSNTKRVVLTKGGKGSTIATWNGIYNIEAHPVQVVDTTGAGDAFAAGFICGLIRGLREDRAGELASRIASMIVGQKSARIDEQSLLVGMKRV